MHKVLVLGNVRPEGLDILRTFAELTILPEPASKADVLACIADMDAILHKIGKVDREIMAKQKKLRIVARHGVGLDDLDLDAIAEQKIPVSITLDANSNAVAEATLGLIFSVLRKIPRGEAMIKRHRRWERETLMGRELKGSTVGIIGYGRIGRLVANYLAALGCTIIIHDADPETANRADFTVVPLDVLLARADIISVHCPLTPETRHLIDADALRLVKPDCMIVNTSRGALIDTQALAIAAMEGRIGGAALDVFDPEPPDFEDAVFACENVVTTPHIAAMTVDAQSAMATGAATEIRRVLLEGLPPSNDVFASRE